VSCGRPHVSNQRGANGKFCKRVMAGSQQHPKSFFGAIIHRWMMAAPVFEGWGSF
jgi:hypothetical protein